VTTPSSSQVDANRSGCCRCTPPSPFPPAPPAPPPAPPQHTPISVVIRPIRTNFLLCRSRASPARTLFPKSLDSRTECSPAEHRNYGRRPIDSLKTRCRIAPLPSRHDRLHQIPQTQPTGLIQQQARRPATESARGIRRFAPSCEVRHETLSMQSPTFFGKASLPLDLSAPTKTPPTSPTNPLPFHASSLSFSCSANRPGRSYPPSGTALCICGDGSVPVGLALID
jgi:hypothetical protein